MYLYSCTLVLLYLLVYLYLVLYSSYFEKKDPTYVPTYSLVDHL